MNSEIFYIWARGSDNFIKSVSEEFNDAKQNLMNTHLITSDTVESLSAEINKIRNISKTQEKDRKGIELLFLLLERCSYLNSQEVNLFHKLITNENLSIVAVVPEVRKQLKGCMKLFTKLKRFREFIIVAFNGNKNTHTRNLLKPVFFFKRFLISSSFKVGIDLSSIFRYNISIPGYWTYFERIPLGPQEAVHDYIKPRKAKLGRAIATLVSMHVTRKATLDEVTTFLKIIENYIENDDINIEWSVVISPDVTESTADILVFNKI